MTNHLINKPTTELLLKELDQVGFCCIKNAIRPELVEKLGDVVGNENNWHKEYETFHGKNSYLAPNIINKSEACLSLIMDQAILDIAEKYFRTGAYPTEENIFQFHLMHGRTLVDECSSQELHMDSRCCGINPPSHLHFFLYLDDCLNSGDGATRFVPGSHRYNRYSNEADNIQAKEVYGKKGTLIVLNSAVYHGSSAKSTKGVRRLLTFAYSRWFIRQPFSVPYFKNWARKLTEHEKIILGFNNYGATNDYSRVSARGTLPELIPENYV